MRRSVIMALVLLGVASAASAQQLPEHASRDWTNVEIYLSVAVLGFALVVLVLQTVLITRAQPSWHPKSTLRMMGLTLIISAGLFLVTAGYSADQVSPVMGLLGTIAGYLLGAGEAAGRVA